ncbi:MAG: 3-methyl-2-oxobutanoate hydroxymethyltransferase [Bradymonadia bacterium]|jgi:3-methyl-2-oxobutanoate hydroxymethyltransferase
MSLSIADLQKKKANGEKITMITAYDATFTLLVEAAGIDIILIGDSLGNVIQGRSTTLPVTLDEMIYHASCVSRVSKHSFLVCDLNFGSYQCSTEDGLRSAIRIMKESQVHCVKLEGGARVLELTQAITDAGIPVMGHLGLTPQSVHQMGGFKVQGRDEKLAAAIKADALALQDAGASSLVLEGIPRGLAAEITASLAIPTIGIGAGPDCDGQVLVLQDLLGLNMGKMAKFVKPYAKLGQSTIDAVSQYIAEVKSGQFPDDAHSYR